MRSGLQQGCQESDLQYQRVVLLWFCRREVWRKADENSSWNMPSNNLVSSASWQ